jgi:hypothetical protein
MRILPLTGHSFCATLILSLEFSAVLGFPEAARRIDEKPPAPRRKILKR